MNWTPNSPIASTLYIILVQQGEIDNTLPFNEVGQLRLNQLNYFDTSADVSSAQTAATMLAFTIENSLLNSYRAVYIGSPAEALSELRATLSNPQNSVYDLAATIARHFLLDETNNTGPKLY